jgi:phosphatidylcholine synthase
VVVLIVLTFVPIKFVHPMRVARWRIFTLLVVAVWSVASLYALHERLVPEQAVIWLVTACGIYLMGIGAVMPARR